MLASAGLLALGTIAVRAARARDGSLSGAADVTAVRTDATTITVAWTDISRAAKSWSVMAQGSYHGPWELWRTIQVTPRAASVRREVKFGNVPERKVFCFRVVGHYRLDNYFGSTPSAVACAVSAPPHTPQRMVVQWDRSYNDIYVVMQNPLDWEWSYRIEVSQPPVTEWEKNSDSLGTRQGFGAIHLKLNPPLRPGKRYCVRVVAWNPLGEAQPSEMNCGQPSAQ